VEERRDMEQYRVDEREVYRSGEWVRFCNLPSGIYMELFNKPKKILYQVSENHN
jgi:hypothetical protein